MRSMLNLAIALAMALLPAPAARAAQDAAGCEAAKLRACATSALTQLKCYARAEKEGLINTAVCHGEAERNFREAFDRIDSRGGCAVTGDSLDYEVEVDAFVRDVVYENLCSEKIKAGGTTAKFLLTCYARTRSPSCFDVAESRLEKAFTKADKRGCVPTGGTYNVLAYANIFVAAVVGPPPPTNIRIFMGASGVNGNLGSRPATNTSCNVAAANQNLTCSGVVSLLSYTGDAIVDFPANYGVPTTVPLIAGAGDVTVANDWADFLDGTWQTCLGSNCQPAGPTPAGIVPDTSGIWTGAAPNGATADNCSNWTDGAFAAGSNASPSCYGVSDSFICGSSDALGQASGGASCASPVQSVLCLCY